MLKTTKTPTITTNTSSRTLVPAAWITISSPHSLFIPLLAFARRHRHSNNSSSVGVVALAAWRSSLTSPLSEWHDIISSKSPSTSPSTRWIGDMHQDELLLQRKRCISGKRKKSTYTHARKAQKKTATSGCIKLICRLERSEPRDFSKNTFCKRKLIGGWRVFVYRVEKRALLKFVVDRWGGGGFGQGQGVHVHWRGVFPALGKAQCDDATALM